MGAYIELSDTFNPQKPYFMVYSLSLGEGDCDSHEDCQGNLLCGKGIDRVSKKFCPFLYSGLLYKNRQAYFGIQ